MRAARGGDTLAPVETPPANRLYYGDNLAVLRDAISSESVDLIYLDPPFNSNANYNVLFSEFSPGGGGVRASHRFSLSRIPGTGETRASALTRRF